MRISIRKIKAIIGMKFQTLLSNTSVMLGPILALGFVFAIKNIMPDLDVNKEGISFSTNAFVLSFGIIFNIAIAGISMRSSPLAEEKEKNTLRVLMTSSVNGLEYLIGTLLPPLFILILVNILMIPVSGSSFGEVQFGSYLLMTTVASLISLLIGYIIGILTKNQTQTSLYTMPITLLLTSVPAVKLFKEDLSEILDYTYTGVLTNFSNSIFSETGYQWNLTDISVLFGWFIICLVIFVYAYKKNGLDS
ncbi:ABC transporter permease [Rossellomorea aquimaris]|uniref:ABC transporter permease n=1 Tax=Rossellomorea aquimaris TaxID=189382 RepID=A0A5D4TUY6_9BACI|nr:ABC transporter permease [Rossellomorea aquimaris]TYS77896.1 ABC transporter permease [Rossellomorea aquimaris]TYS87079.1 ABC transporter permease [Rossellomorea aquimaris]